MCKAAGTQRKLPLSAQHVHRYISTRVCVRCIDRIMVTRCTVARLRRRLGSFQLSAKVFVPKHVNLMCTGRVTVARYTLAQCGKQSYKSPLYAEMLQSQGATLHKAAGKLRKVPLSAEICVHTHVCVGYPTA